MSITDPSSLRAIATSPSYAEVERAVDRLADAQFPVEHLSIVGQGLHSREQVIGRATWGRAAGEGALQGALLGVLFALVLGLFTLDPDIAFGWLVLAGLGYGGLSGAVVGLSFRALRSPDREFLSVSGFEAHHYDVVIDDDTLAEDAVRLLNATGTPTRG